MKTPILQSLALLLAMASTSAFALSTADLLNNAASKALLEKKCLRLEVTDLVPIPFASVCKTFSQPQLLKAAQQEYARSVSKTGTIEFPLLGTAAGQYYFIDKKGHRTAIAERYQKQTDEHSFNYILHASGTRFLGRYDAVIHLQILDAGQAGSVFTTRVHAYPNNGATRFFVRRLGTTQRYFKKKTQLIAYLAREIGIGLCEQAPFQPDWTTSKPD